MQSVLRQLLSLGRCSRTVSIAILLTGVSSLWAEPEPAAEPVTDIMHGLAKDVQILLPMMYQEDSPTTAADIALISDTIAHMRSHLDKISTTVAPRSDTYQISFELLANQLDQAQRQFSEGHDKYGMEVLRSATSVCASCHTQDDRTARWLAPTTESMSDAFIEAQFLFMTRQYKPAFTAYETWLSQQDSLPYDNRTRTAFQRLLLTALQVNKSPGAINGVLDKFIDSGNIDSLLEKNLIDWTRGVEALEQSVDISMHPEPAKLKDLAIEWLRISDGESLGHAYMSETNRPQIVWLRGEMYRALNSETDQRMVANWLYWLAVSDRLLEYRFYYSLADMYLKQCMLEYTAEPVAQTCYREYENYVEFFYSGSSGTHIPEDVASEMEMLRDKVFSGER